MQKKERECLRVSECGPREMIYELGRVKLQGKMTRITEISKGCCVFVGLM